MRQQHESYEPDPFEEIAEAKKYKTHPAPRDTKRQREIIRPAIGQPLTVNLSCETPDQVQGLWGPQWMYSVNRNTGMMYVNEAGYNAIQKTGARQGDCIHIARTRGSWQVTICEDEPHTAPPANARPDSAHQAKPPVANGNAYREPRKPAAPREVQTAAARAAEMPAQRNEVYPLADEFTPFLRAAAIACFDIQNEAGNRGHKLDFTPRDISAIASTLYIQHRKGER